MKKQYIIYIALVLVSGTLGYIINSSTIEDEHTHTEQETNQIWTCSMHPHIRMSEAGQCPICGMDLIPLETNSNPQSTNIVMSETAMKLANIQTEVVLKKKATKELRISGKLKADERSVHSQTSHIAGRVEKLLINFNGEYITKGQVIAYLYSPNLVTAQEELISASKTKATQPLLFEAAKTKLKNWKLTDKQINQIVKSGSAKKDFPILSNFTGIIHNKKVNKGDHIKQGATLFSVSDLSNLWGEFDIYEKDLSWINTGDEIEFSTQAYPNEKRTWKINFLDPVINSKTRTAIARIVIDNTNGKLKPEMFVNGILKSEMKNSEIIVPKSAVMWTGKRSVVYIKHKSESGVYFNMQEVTLGTTIGDAYIISKGLNEGVEIATNGTFSIDASAQLAGLPSMMNTSPTTTEEINLALKPLYNSYIKLKEALTKDDYELALLSAHQFQESLTSIDMNVSEDENHPTWMMHQTRLNKTLEHLQHFNNIEELRNAFLHLSTSMIKLTKDFKPLNDTLYLQHCPMANNSTGADWLSLEKQIKNPYFGESMLQCGEVKKEIR